MQNEVEFRKFLKRGGRSTSTINRCVKYTLEFERYLQQHYQGTSLDDATPAQLEAFVLSVEKRPKISAKTHL